MIFSLCVRQKPGLAFAATMNGQAQSLKSDSLERELPPELKNHFRMPNFRIRALSLLRVFIWGLDPNFWEFTIKHSGPKKYFRFQRNPFTRTPKSAECRRVHGHLSANAFASALEAMSRSSKLELPTFRSETFGEVVSTHRLVKFAGQTSGPNDSSKTGRNS